MNRKYLYQILIILLTTFSLQAQINFQLIVKKPVPIKFSTWQRDQSIIQLILTNLTLNNYQNISVSFTLKDQNGRRIAYTKDTDPKMKKFNLNAGQTLIIYGPDVLNYDVVSYDESIRNTIVTTNALPEGSYSLCVRILDSFGNEVGTGGEKCEYFSIFLPEPPVLISPANDFTTNNYLPQFIWTPVVGSDPTVSIDYRIKIAKILQGQTPKSAIENNIPILDKYFKTTSYQYLPSDLNLNNYSDNLGFAWQVQAIDAITRQPVAGKEGKSEIWRFYTHSVSLSNLLLISPADNSELSPVGAGFKFVWDATLQKKTKTGFIIKIVELNQGQTPANAIKTNNPVFYKDDINPNVNNFTLEQSFNVLKNDKKYAWQMFTVSQQWGGIIDESEVRTFTVKDDFVEVIDLVSPSNNTFIELDTSKNIYNFKWNASKVKKSISNFILKIAPIENGQTPAQAMHNNSAVFYKADIIPQASNYMIGKNQGVLANRKYVWQITAISKWYNNQIVAASDIWTFEVKTAPTILENVNLFTIGAYKVEVKQVTNKSSNNFSGVGEVVLWTGGPKLSFEFSGLQLSSVGTGNNIEWEVINGEIWRQVTPTTITLDYRDPAVPLLILPGSPYIKSVATLEIKGIRFSPNSNLVTGNIKLKTPLLSGAANPNVMVETNDSWFRVNPINKVDSGLTKPKNAIKTLLIYPNNFNYELSLQSEFRVDKHRLILKLQGSVTLPSSVKDRDGKNISVAFKDAGGFKFDVDLNNQLVYYKVNPDMWIKFNFVNLDLYTGIFRLKEGFIGFDQYKSGGLESFGLEENDNTFLNNKGLNCKISRSESNPKFSNFRGYEFKIKSFNLEVLNNNIISASNLKGEIFIPYLKQYANLNLQINKNGISSGSINADFINNKWINVFTSKTGSGKISLKVVGIGYYSFDNTFKMNAYFKFEDTPGKGVITDQLAVSNLTIDSIGAVSIYGANSTGWKFLDVAKTGKFNGFPVTIDRINVSGKFSYLTGVAGTIVLSDDLSNPNGTPFRAVVEIPKTTSGGKDASFETISNGEISSDDIPLKFGNNSSAFDATVKWFDNDPVYGKGFMSQIKLNMKNPGNYSVDSKIMIGKTDNGNGFSYWFVESGVEFGSPVSVGFLDIGIMGFKGRIYSKMKHSGKGISSSDYVPDKNNKFGVYAKLPITSFSDIGKKFWGSTELEIMVGNGFSSVLYGELFVLSDGYGDKSAKIKGNATISVSTNPKVFDTEVNVSANLWDALCGEGQFKMHITDKEWYVKLGSKQNPINMRLLCSSSGFTGYLEILPSFSTLNIGYSFDTGNKTWGEVFGCWGRAWGGIDVTGNLNYSPFQVAASASLVGNAKIGVFIDLAVWSGYKTLLEGSVLANLQATFPDPFCMAGSIYAEACFDPCPVFSCDICASATLKLRYKNGSFALKSNCSD